MVFVPKALSPHFSEPTVQIWHTGRQEKQPDKETFFFDRHSAQPGRDDRNKQVNADQGIHKP